MSEEARPQGVFGGRAFSIGRVAGIPLAVDATWLLVFLLVTLSIHAQMGAAHPDWSGGAGWIAAGITSLLFFASILLHELGHSVVAQRLGVGVRSITLFVFGGVAQLESEPERPADEVKIAIAGPLVSFALAGGFWALAQLLGGSGVVGEASAWLGRINLTVAIFNLVPGFPLDGGRVLRGILWARSGSMTRATAVAGAVGSAFAYGLIALGIFTAIVGRQFVGGLWLAFIGWFLLSAARAGVSAGILQQVLAQVRASEAMEPLGDRGVAGDTSVEQLIQEAVLRRGHRTFYVMDAAGSLRGIVALAELAGVPPEQRTLRRVDEIMIPRDRLAVLLPQEDGWTALRRMVEAKVNQLPVLDGERVIGTLTRERLLVLVQARMALEGIDTPETAAAR